MGTWGTKKIRRGRKGQTRRNCQKNKGRRRKKKKRGSNKKRTRREKKDRSRKNQTGGRKEKTPGLLFNPLSGCYF